MADFQEGVATEAYEALKKEFRPASSSTTAGRNL